MIPILYIYMIDYSVTKKFISRDLETLSSIECDIGQTITWCPNVSCKSIFKKYDFFFLCKVKEASVEAKRLKSLSTFKCGIC